MHNRPAAVTVPFMAARPIARLLQLAALVILPLAVVAQLGNRITAGQLLQFMVVGVALFSIGYLLQSYGGGER